MTDYNATWWGRIYLAWKQFRAEMKSGGAEKPEQEQGETEQGGAEILQPSTPSDIHRASFLFDNAGTRCMNAFGMPEQKFKETVERCRKNGDNIYYAFLNNEHDGNHAGFSPYKDNKIGGTIDEAKVKLLKDRIAYIRAYGMKVILWLRADDSPTFNRADLDAQKRMQSDIVRLFDGYVSGYCLGLEYDEYDKTSNMKAMAAHLRQHTDRDIGIHLTSGNKASTVNSVLGVIGGARTYYWQAGFGLSTDRIKSEAKAVRSKLDSGIRLIAAEYHKSSDSEAAKYLGDAALAGGADGTGNGCHVMATEIVTANTVYTEGTIHAYS